MNLLVCDDDAVLRTVMSEIGVARGYSVVAEVATSREAIEWLEGKAIDVAVVDLSLRYGSGFDVLESALEHGTPVVLFSAFADGLDGRTLPGKPRIVHKPDFTSLERALDEMASPATTSAERRAAAQRADALRLTGGVDDAHVFYEVLSRATAGDVLMSVELAGADDVALSHLVSAARASVRAEDRVMRSPTGVTILLMAVGPDPGAAVEARLTAAWTGAPLVVRRTAIGEQEQPADAFDRLRRTRQPDALAS